MKHYITRSSGKQGRTVHLEHPTEATMLCGRAQANWDGGYRDLLELKRSKHQLCVLCFIRAGVIDTAVDDWGHPSVVVKGEET